MVRLRGDLDLSAAGAVTDQLSALVDVGCCHITLDMRQADFCDAAGPWALMLTSATLDARSGRVVVVACPTPRLMLSLLPDRGFRLPELADIPA